MLYSLARAEMRRQDIRKQLEEVDMEIMGYLQRFAVKICMHTMLLLHLIFRVIDNERKESQSVVKKGKQHTEHWIYDRNLQNNY